MANESARQSGKPRLPAWRRSGEFGRSWWANRWLDALESIVDDERLQRGRRYARSWRVLSMHEVDGTIEATVQGSRISAYKVRIGLSHLADAAWERLLLALSEQAAHSARLLNEEMPAGIGEICERAGVNLFPEAEGDLTTDCSCPDWVNPCKHVAAVYYCLAKEFDDDPFLLFRLRGRTREQVLQALLGDDAAGDDAPTDFGLPPEVAGPAFWRCGRPLSDVAITIGPPTVRLPALKRLGEPPFGADVLLADRLGPRLDEVARAALAAAYAEEAEEG